MTSQKIIFLIFHEIFKSGTSVILMDIVYDIEEAEKDNTNLLIVIIK